jgi:hypothetical protein
MAGDELMTHLAEALAKVTGRGSAAESVAETLDKHLAGGSAGTAAPLSGLASQLDQLRQASQQQANVLAENTTAVAQNTNLQGNATLSSALKPLSILSSVFGGGFGISPLFSGIMKLFGGGSKEVVVETPVEYEKPEAVNITGGYSRASDNLIYALDYAAGDKPRLLRAAMEERPTPSESWSGMTQALLRDLSLSAETGIQPAATALEQLRQPATAASGWSAERTAGTASSYLGGRQMTTGGNTGGTSMAPQITVQVQAMDSRSFLDHSEDIARAVREAMLNSHGINDVITEL